MATVPTMNITDPEVYRLAAELAERRHTSMTDAVRQALTETLSRDTTEGERIGRLIAEAAAEWRAAGGTVTPEEEIHDDETGLPI
jgi:antitoxin VapB